MKFFLFSFLLLISFQLGLSQQSNKPKQQEMYDAIKVAGIEQPDIVMAQCIQETGWMKCRKCCLRFNNYFGFIVSGNKCKKFSSRDECIAYYKKWQDKRLSKWKAKHPKGTYYDFLKAMKYASNPKYNAELKIKVAWVRKHLKL